MSEAEEQARLEEEDRLRRVADQRAFEVKRLEEEYASLTDEEVVSALVSMPDHVIAPIVMTMRLIAATEKLEKRLASTERLTWALVFLTVVLLAVTAVLAVDTLAGWFDWFAD